MITGLSLGFLRVATVRASAGGGFQTGWMRLSLSEPDSAVLE